VWVNAVVRARARVYVVVLVLVLVLVVVIASSWFVQGLLRRRRPPEYVGNSLHGTWASCSFFDEYGHETHFETSISRCRSGYCGRQRGGY
jgi:hypothetical protein